MWVLTLRRATPSAHTAPNSTAKVEKLCPHGSTTQEDTIKIFATVRTSNPVVLYEKTIDVEEIKCKSIIQYLFYSLVNKKLLFLLPTKVSHRLTLWGKYLVVGFQCGWYTLVSQPCGGLQL
jgi:hypothetical protein